MKKRISVKCIVLMLTAIALVALAGIGVMAASSTEDVIQYRGRSLRIDETSDGSKTSLRFGYTIKLPDGAKPDATEDGGTEWISWEYTMDGNNPGDSSAVAAIKKKTAISVGKNEDGTYTANLVIKGIPSAYYRRSFYAKMTVKYVDADVNQSATDVWRNTTIKEVADAIESKTTNEMDGKNEVDAAYAKTLNEKIGNYAAMVVDRMYLTVPEAIEKVENNGTVFVLKTNGVEKPIIIDKSVTLQNMYGTSAVVKDTRADKDSSMITVASGGELTIAGNGLTIWGDIKAEGNITLEKGTIKGTVELSNEEGGKSLSVGEKGSLLVDSDTKVGGLTSAETGERTKPLLTLLDESANLPQIHISETKAGTVVMEIPDALIESESGGIKLDTKKNAQLKLTCTDSAQLMWGEEKKITVQDAKAHIHCACGGNAGPIAHCGTAHWDIKYDKLESDTNAGVGGNYYLPEGDITIDSTQVGTSSTEYGYYHVLNKNLNLCLNGYTLIGNGTKRVIYVAGTSTVNVTGFCSASEKKNTAKVPDVKDPIQYGTLKRIGSASAEGGCLNNASTNAKIKMYNVYLDGSEYMYKGTGNGATLKNAGGSMYIINCLISKDTNNVKGAYNGGSGVLPYTPNAYTTLYEFPTQQ